MNKLKTILFTKTAFLFLIVLIIYLFEQNTNWVEHYYSNGLYQYTSYLQGFFISWIPISFGDILYLLSIIFFLYKLIVVLRKIYSAKNKKSVLLIASKNLLQAVLIIFISFELLWGINYSRLGVAYQFNLKKKGYTSNELTELIQDLIFDANKCRQQISDTSLPDLSIDSIFFETKKCYASISKFYPFLKTSFFAVKPSVFSFAGNYFGYTGYCNPFTGEAQIRADLPRILLPFICCHEVAHQLGYASEEEANFIACIAANESKDIRFKYSLDLELLDYAQKELMLHYIADNEMKKYLMVVNSFKDCTSIQVKKDRKAIRDFFSKNRKDVANISNFVYDKYLKLNKQQQGLESYNAVVDWVLSYRKQFLYTNN